jgi:hypothetical protein
MYRAREFPEDYPVISDNEQLEYEAERDKLFVKIDNLLNAPGKFQDKIALLDKYNVRDYKDLYYNKLIDILADLRGIYASEKIEIKLAKATLKKLCDKWDYSLEELYTKRIGFMADIRTISTVALNSMGIGWSTLKHVYNKDHTTLLHYQKLSEILLDSKYGNKNIELHKQIINDTKQIYYELQIGRARNEITRYTNREIDRTLGI